MGEHERADEEISLPAGKRVSGVKGHAGGRDRGHPVIDRLLHAFLVGAFVNLGAGIVDAEADHRPAVILALLRHVDLVAALGPVLDDPQFAAHRVDRRGLDVAVAVRPDFGLGVFVADEGIVGRHRAVGADADHLAEMAGEILRRRLEVALARRQEQRAVAGDRDARAEMEAALDRRLLAENHLHVGELRLAAFFEEARACERSAVRVDRAIGPARLGEAEIDDAALFAQNRARARCRAGRLGRPRRPRARLRPAATISRPYRECGAGPGAR